jgi:hypothetical protein
MNILSHLHFTLKNIRDRKHYCAFRAYCIGIDGHGGLGIRWRWGTMEKWGPGWEWEWEWELGNEGKGDKG